MHTAQLDPRIGMLSSGKFYAFAHGTDKPETVGALPEVEHALGIHKAPSESAYKPQKMFDVVMRFADPA